MNVILFTKNTQTERKAIMITYIYIYIKLTSITLSKQWIK